MIKGKKVGNVFVPIAQVGTAKKWAPEIAFIAACFPDTHLLVTSGSHSLKGGTRPELSHACGAAVDIGVMYSADSAVGPDMKSPRLFEKVSALQHLANNLPSVFPGVYAESDHFHVDISLPAGVYSAHKYRDGIYTNDKHRSKAHDADAIYRVNKDGSTSKAYIHRIRVNGSLGAQSGRFKS